MTNKTTELLTADRENVARLKDIFQRYDASDRDGFALILKVALKNGVTRQQLREAFGVSAGTISRWESQESAPIEITRKTIVSHLADMISPVEVTLEYAAA